MIVSASYRTDIPAFHADWFRHRLAAGFALVRNPYGGPPYRVELGAEAVDGFVFWTRNAAPFLPVLDALAARKRPFVVQFTLTAYPRFLERAVPAPEAASAQIERLARRFGVRAVVWRYDPILLTERTDAGFHEANFAALASRLEGLVDEVVISFAHFYAKTRRRLARAAARDAIHWWDPAPEEKHRLRVRLEALARARGMRLTVCAQAEVGGTPAACIDAARLSAVAGYEIAARTKGNRPGCGCAESRDLGAYDSCGHGCVYCYAVASHERATARLRDRDPQSLFLIPADAPPASETLESDAQAEVSTCSPDSPSPSPSPSAAAGGLATPTSAGRSSRS